MTLTVAAGPNACLLIPFYHPDCLLPTVKEALALGLPLLVVVHEDLDPAIRCQLGEIRQVHLIPMPGNWNKGEALALGLKHALCLGYDLAASLDATGRYEPREALKLLETAGLHASQKKRTDVHAQKIWDSIVIGAESDPKKRKSWSLLLSNFWFWIETGLNIPDTRSSLRVYPLMPMNAVHARFGGSGWEIEAMARSVWGGVRLVSVPVSTHEERTPPQTRSWRRSLSLMAVHIYLVLRRLLPAPFRPLVPKPKIEWPATWKEKLKFIWKEYLWQPNETPGEIAFAVGFGVCCGLSPFWGWHTLIALYFAQRLHLNKVLVVAGSYVSIPPLIPFILYANLVLGKAVLQGEWEWRMRFSEFTLSQAHERLWEFVVGSLIIAAICGLLAQLVVFVALRYVRPWLARIRKSLPRP